MKRKKSMQSTPSPCSSPKLDVNLELDIKALRGKNKQLTQAVAKLQQDKKSQQDQITSLQEDFFNLNSKYVNLKNIFSNIDAAAKVMFPKQVELAEMFGRIMQLCAVGVTVSNLNKDPVTQPVKPHIVNGHVLQNPTITLSRLHNDSPSHTPPRIRTNMNDAPEASGFQTGRNSINNSVIDEISSSSNNMRETISEVETPPRVSRRRTNPERQDVANTSGNESLEEEENNTSEPGYCSRLITIQEEDEEQYSTTLSPVNNSQSGLSPSVSRRVREIRIILDPLPKDSIASNAGDSSSRSYLDCASPEQPSTSSINLSRKLLDSSLGSTEDTMKFITSALDSQNFTFSTSSTDKSSDYFRMHRSDSLNESIEVARVQIKRGKHRKSEVKPQKSELGSTSDVMFSDRASPVDESNMPHYDTSFGAPSSIDMEISKEEALRGLGLEPNNSQLMVTSTPVVNSPRSSLRNKNLNSSIKNVTRLSPTDSKVTKKRGGSNEKIVRVLLKRVSGEKKLSGSPLKKVCDLLDTAPITKAADLKRSKNKKNRKESPDDQQDSSSTARKNASSGSNSTKKNINNNTKVKNKGKENRHSPRPRRAVKPTQLKEPSLNKKMRRSR